MFSLSPPFFSLSFSILSSSSSTPFILILFPIYSQEVTQDIDDETRRMNEFKKKKMSTDNVAIDRLASLLRTGQKETTLQKLARETEQSRTQLLGQEDARTLLDQENVLMMIRSRECELLFSYFIIFVILTTLRYTVYKSCWWSN